MVVVIDDLVIVNHYSDSSDPSERSGWIMVSPVRHVTRLFELTADEQRRLFATVARVDRVLTEEFGSTRTLMASLGWNVSDHGHFHVAPTFSDGTYPTYGWENFRGVEFEHYREVDAGVQEVIAALRREFDWHPPR